MNLESRQLEVYLIAVIPRISPDANISCTKPSSKCNYIIDIIVEICKNAYHYQFVNTSEFKINDRDNIVHLSRYINNDNHNNKCNESGMSYSSRTICTIQIVFDSDHVHGVSLTQLLLLKGGVLQLGFLHSH